MYEHIYTTTVDDVSILNYKVSFLLPHNEYSLQYNRLTILMSVATCPFASERGEAHGCAFQRRKDARSRHQRLFVENVGKTEGNRSK